MICILYVIVVGTLLGVAGLLVERTMPATSPRRWVWCIVIAGTMLVPAIYRTQHTAPVGEAVGATHAHAGASVTAVGADWWARAAEWDRIINPLWLTASAALLIWGLVSAWQVSRMVRKSRSEGRINGSPAFLDGVPVLVTDAAGPATIGVLRSHVLVPRWVLALPGVQRTYVVRHEDEHRRAHDAALLFGASLLLVLTPWNLALWWQLRRLRLAVEMDCDNRVVSALGNAPAYGELLFKVANAAARGPRLQPALLGSGMLERRLIALLDPAPVRAAQRYLLPALAAAILAAVLSMPHPVLVAPSGATMTASVPQGNR